MEAWSRRGESLVVLEFGWAYDVLRFLFGGRRVSLVLGVHGFRDGLCTDGFWSVRSAYSYVAWQGSRFMLLAHMSLAMALRSEIAGRGLSRVWDVRP